MTPGRTAGRVGVAILLCMPQMLGAQAAPVERFPDTDRTNNVWTRD
jgi:hypothetical protein